MRTDRNYFIGTYIIVQTPQLEYYQDQMVLKYPYQRAKPSTLVGDI
jgi:hypothetical protein